MGRLLPWAGRHSRGALAQFCQARESKTEWESKKKQGGGECIPSLPCAGLITLPSSPRRRPVEEGTEAPACSQPTQESYLSCSLCCCLKPHQTLGLGHSAHTYIQVCRWPCVLQMHTKLLGQKDKKQTLNTFGNPKVYRTYMLCTI